MSLWNLLLGKRIFLVCIQFFNWPNFPIWLNTFEHVQCFCLATVQLQPAPTCTRGAGFHGTACSPSPRRPLKTLSAPSPLPSLLSSSASAVYRGLAPPAGLLSPRLSRSLELHARTPVVGPSGSPPPNDTLATAPFFSNFTCVQQK